MSTVLTSQRKLGDVVKYEELVSKGHCRQTATVNVTSAFQVGTVVDNDGDGTYSIVAAADVATLATDVAIVIDDAVYDGVTGDRSIVILSLNRGGEAGVAGAALSFADALSGPQRATVYAALEAKGFQVLTQV